MSDFIPRKSINMHIKGSLHIHVEPKGDKNHIFHFLLSFCNINIVAKAIWDQSNSGEGVVGTNAELLHYVYDAQILL